MVRRRVRNLRRREGKGKGGFVYLGKKVKDIGERGYDTKEEGLGIAYAILRDYDNHKINRLTFNRRTALLGLSTIRNNKLSKRDKASVIAYINLVRTAYGFTPLKFKSMSKDKTFQKYYDDEYENWKKFVIENIEKQLTR
ncbi:MAG: hypothetical protein J7L47_04985 [Candidatus Odinarchaeota archaeon]|nr:hypothetical protein [Candidatus Odinarchaeota archaeon]